MSLINDALKRARQAQQENPFDRQPGAPLQPVDDLSRRNYFLRSAVALLAVVMLGYSGWFFWKWWGNHAGRRSVVAVNQTKADPVAQPKIQPKSPPRKSVIQVSTNIVVRTNAIVAPKPGGLRSTPTNTPIATLPAGDTAPEAPAEPSAPPSPVADLKLRSIIYREDRPAAVINGDMVYVGDEIRGARVVRIERQSVIVERKGETNELRLPRL